MRNTYYLRPRQGEKQGLLCMVIYAESCEFTLNHVAFKIDNKLVAQTWIQDMRIFLVANDNTETELPESVVYKQ